MLLLHVLRHRLLAAVADRTVHVDFYRDGQQLS